MDQNLTPTGAPANPGGPHPAPVVTISASYGAGGSLVAPALAERLGLALVDRLLTAAVSEEAHTQEVHSRGEHSEEALSDREAGASPPNRLFTYLARAAGVGTLGAPPLVVDTDEELRGLAEAGLAALRDGVGGVVLGRAGAVVLAQRSGAYHVRLDGPVDRRIKAAAAMEGVSLERSAASQARTDRARELWVRRLYRADVRDPSWYHLWLDTTVVGVDGSVEVIALALEKFKGARPN